MTTKNGKNMSKALMMGTALVTLSALDAHAAPGTGSMSAVVLTPIVVAAPTDINFGSITHAGVGGTVVVTPTGGRQAGGGPTQVVGLGNETFGVLSISGATGVNIDLAMTATSFAVSNGTATMAVNAFNIDVDAGGTAETITLTASPGTVPIGATLNVGAAQAAGTYTGTYNLTAGYQ